MLREDRLPQRCDGHRGRAGREDRGVRVMGELLGRGFYHFSGSWLVRLDPGSRDQELAGRWLRNGNGPATGQRNQGSPGHRV